MQIELESPKQLADRIGWPVSRIRKLVKSEKIRYYRFGKSILIPINSVSEYLASVEVIPKTDLFEMENNPPTEFEFGGLDNSDQSR